MALARYPRSISEYYGSYGGKLRECRDSDTKVNTNSIPRRIRREDHELVEALRETPQDVVRDRRGSDNVCATPSQ